MSSTMRLIVICFVAIVSIASVVHSAAEKSKIIEIKNFRQLGSLQNDHYVAILGLFKDLKSSSAELFTRVAGSIGDITFGITSDERFFKNFGVRKNTVILFKKFDEREVAYSGPFVEEDLRDFIKSNRYPLVFVLDSMHVDHVQKVTETMNINLQLFVSEFDDDFDQYVEEFREAAKLFRGQVVFTRVDTDDEVNEKHMYFFGVQRRHLPLMRLMTYYDHEVVKYKPDDAHASITLENIKRFVQSYLDKQLKPYLLAEDVPEDWDSKTVKFLTAKNFKQVAHDKSKNTIVFFYAPWGCKHCVTLNDTFFQMAEATKYRPDLVCGMMNIYANQIEGMSFATFPQVKMWGKNSDIPADYSGSASLQDMLDFVEPYAPKSSEIKPVKKAKKKAAIKPAKVEKEPLRDEF